MSRNRMGLVSVIAAACAFAGVLLVAEPASAASRGYKIYDLSSHKLRLQEVAPVRMPNGPTLNFPNGLFPIGFEGRPEVGEVLKPGAPPQIFELKYVFGTTYAAKLLYDIVGTNRDFVVTIETSTTSNDSTCSIAKELGTCTAEGLAITVLDPAATVHDIPADQAQAQANTLRELCNKTSTASCEFSLTKEPDDDIAEEGRIGTYVVNCTPGPVTRKVVREDKIGQSNSLGIETGVEAETNFIIEKAKVSVKTKYGHEWTEEHTFREEVDFDIDPGHKAWVELAAPVRRFTGNFILKLGNTTWTLHNVYFDTPRPDATATWVVRYEELTPEQYRNICHAEPPGKKALAAGPPSF